MSTTSGAREALLSANGSSIASSGSSDEREPPAAAVVRKALQVVGAASAAAACAVNASVVELGWGGWAWCLWGAAVALPVVSLLWWLHSGSLRGPVDTGHFGSVQYNALSAAEKMESLWSKITSDLSPGKLWPAFPWPLVRDLLDMDLSQMQEHVSDETPRDHHIKLIHSQGVVAKMRWVSTGDHPYTGMFRGEAEGVIRYSCSVDADYSQTYVAPGTQAGASGFGPGAGIKLLRDGQPSANLVAIAPNGALGQVSYNFFRQPWVTHVGAPCIALLKDKFATSSPLINMVGLRDFGCMNAAGEQEPSPQYPFQLKLVPHEGVATRFPDRSKHEDPAGPGSMADVLTQLCSLAAGETMHHVQAQAAPDAPWVKIAEVVLVSAPVTSKWADERLFFRHGQFMDDLEQNPEWLEKLHSVYGRTGFFKTCPATARHRMYEQVCAEEKKSALYDIDAEWDTTGIVPDS